MSSENESTSVSTRIARPYTGIEGINHAVRALYTFKRAATYKELAKPAGVSNVYMSLSLSAARQVGLAELTGKARGSYKLTEKGKAYTMFLTAGKEANCRDLLREVISTNPWWLEIINFLKMNTGKERDILDLVLDIEAKSGKKWSNRNRGALGGALASILSYGGLVESKGNKIISTVSAVGEEGKEKEAREEPLDSKKPTPKEDTISPSGFAEYKVPESFILYVRKNSQGIQYFERQIKDDSFLTDWLKLIKASIKEKE